MNTLTGYLFRCYDLIGLTALCVDVLKGHSE